MPIFNPILYIFPTHQMHNFLLFNLLFTLILPTKECQNIVDPRSTSSPLSITDCSARISWSQSWSFVAKATQSEPTTLISIETLLDSPELFHKKTVTVRGRIAQPEMHLDSTELFFDFVFILKEGTRSLVVYGRHDRTQGDSPIAMGNTVEVTGIFWKDRIAHEYHFENNLQAITVKPYPSLIPDRT